MPVCGGPHSTDQDLGLEPMLVAIVRTLPQGWQHPDDLWVSLQLDGHEYGTRKSGPTLQQHIQVESEVRGHWPSVIRRTVRKDQDRNF